MEDARRELRDERGDLDRVLILRAEDGEVEAMQGDVLQPIGALALAVGGVSLRGREAEVFFAEDVLDEGVVGQVRDVV